jgi:hypothetical protein
VRKAVVGQEVTVHVQVASQNGANSGTPAGTATVSGAGGTCTATLSGSAGTATGSCALLATTPGTSKLTGHYSSDPQFLASTSVRNPALRVSPSPTSTTLKLSARRVAYGHEQRERLTVTVSPEFGGVPAGTADIETKTLVICTVSLSAGTGSCPLTPRQLKPGTYHITASYNGVPSYDGSNSGTVPVTVFRR